MYSQSLIPNIEGSLHTNFYFLFICNISCPLTKIIPNIISSEILQLFITYYTLTEEHEFFYNVKIEITKEQHNARIILMGKDFYQGKGGNNLN